jgi:hypothetical protein
VGAAKCFHTTADLGKYERQTRVLTNDEISELRIIVRVAREMVSVWRRMCVQQEYLCVGP